MGGAGRILTRHRAGVRVGAANGGARLGIRRRADDAIGVPQPMVGTTTTVEEAEAIAERAGYPVLVRPSYVLGGRAMEIVRNRVELRRYMVWAVGAMPRGQVLVDKYLQGMEVEVDAISDGKTVGSDA